MGIYDRDYARPYQERNYSMGSGFRGMPPVVKWLLIINFAAFMIDALVFPNLADGPMRFTAMDEYFSVLPISLGTSLQLWRVITYQFLHGDVFHLAFNMMVLYFMGPFVERAWGSRAFIKFYLVCGAAGGLVYTILVLLNVLPPGTMVGASGGIYGLMMALAIMCPQMKVLLWGLVPMTMIRLVILLVIVSLITIAFGYNVGGEFAHLSGLGMGFLYMKYKPWITRRRMEQQKGAWAKKVERERNFHSRVDQILDKVHREGVNSLSSDEKRILQEATRREQNSI